MTTTVKVTLPPGSGSEVGLAVLSTMIELGLSTFVKVQVTVSPAATLNVARRWPTSPDDGVWD